MPMEQLHVKEQAWARHVRPFIARYDTLRPRTRLIARESLRGGKVESFLLAWTKESAPDGEQMYYYDYNR